MIDLDEDINMGVKAADEEDFRRSQPYSITVGEYEDLIRRIERLEDWMML